MAKALKMVSVGPVMVTILSGQLPSEILIRAPLWKNNTHIADGVNIGDVNLLITDKPEATFNTDFDLCVLCVKCKYFGFCHIWNDAETHLFSHLFYCFPFLEKKQNSNQKSKNNWSRVWYDINSFFTSVSMSRNMSDLIKIHTFPIILPTSWNKTWKRENNYDSLKNLQGKCVVVKLLFFPVQGGKQCRCMQRTHSHMEVSRATLFICT